MRTKEGTIVLRSQWNVLENPYEEPDHVKDFVKWVKDKEFALFVFN